MKWLRGVWVGLCAWASGLELSARAERRASGVNEKFEEMGRLANYVGSELKNPLNIALNAIFYAKDALKDSDALAKDPDLRHFLDLAEKELRGAANLVTDLLSFSKMTQLTLSPANVNELLRDVREALQLPDQVSVQEHYADIPRVLIDAKKMRRIFSIIADNAVESMRQRGVLEITTKLEAEAELSALIVVEFYGAGSGFVSESKKIPETIIPIGGGWLDICRRVVAAHGGKIEAETGPGKHDKLSIQLPLQKASRDDRSARA